MPEGSRPDGEGSGGSIRHPSLRPDCLAFTIWSVWWQVRWSFTEPMGTAFPQAPCPLPQPPLSASLTALAAVNLAAFEAAIVIASPVWGLRP
jgi:hypothetical protein